MSSENFSERTVLIWDLPTRVFHWSLALCFIAAWLTSESDRFLYAHVFAGYVFTALLLFRFVWGFFGSKYARFRSFAYDWPSVTAYLKGLITGQASRHIGHNPAGSWAIFAMLFLGLLIVITGFLVFGGEERHGPLKALVSFDVGNAAKEFHEGLAVTMLVIVFLHIAGVIFESIFHKENLIWAMITGHKPFHETATGVHVYPLMGTLLLLAILSSATFYFRGYITETEEAPFRPFNADPLPTNATWLQECSDCHLAFHPTLLPARSWQRMMNEQENHFDEDLALDEETVSEITEFLTKYAAESGLTEPANKISRSVPADQSPQRITELKYWEKQHHEIDQSYWKHKKVKSKSNCGACHLDAEEGWFEDSNMRLPKLE